MNRLQASESLSTFQSQTSSTDFTSTASSLSVIPGPGALSGKAIFALGKAVIRGAENLVIRQRLLFISSKFPHSNAEHFEGIDTAYRDLLELSRVNLYPDSVRFKAIKILLVQIGGQQTHHLLTALRNWPSVEIQLFIADLASFLDPICLCTDTYTSNSGKGSSRTEVIEAYKTSLRSWESHSLVPFLEFLCQVVGLRDSTTQAVIQGGTMDFLLHAYVTGFRDPLSTIDWLDVDCMLLRSSARHLLSLLSTNASGLEQIRRHPLSALWPTRKYASITTTDHVKKDRLDIWLSCEDHIIFWMLVSSFDLMNGWTIRPENHFNDMCVDFLELAGSNTVGLHLSMRALRNLHRMAWQYKSQLSACVVQYFTSRPMERSVDIISLIAWRIYCVSSGIAPEAHLFWLPSEPKPNRLRYHIMNAFVMSAEINQSFLKVLLASNVSGLLRHYLDLDIGVSALPDNDQSTIQDSYPKPSLSDVYTHSASPSLNRELEESLYREAFVNFLSMYGSTANEVSIE